MEGVCWRCAWQAAAVGVGLSIAALSGAAASSLTPRDAFMQAWTAAREGDATRAEQLRPLLADYVLEPYLDYALLLDQVDAIGAEDVNAYRAAHPDLPTTDLLVAAWLTARSEAGDLSGFDAVRLPGRVSAELRCHWARWRVQHASPAEARSTVLRLWLTGASAPDACDPLFAEARATGLLRPEDVDQRLDLAVAARNDGLAKYLADQATPPARLAYNDHYATLRSSSLDSAFVVPADQRAQKYTEQAIIGRIRSDPIAIAADLQAILAAETTPARLKARWQRDLAVFLAADHHAASLPVFAALGPTELDATARGWHVRSALVHGRWREMHDAIAAMPPVLAQDTRWQYWRAESARQAGLVQAFTAPTLAQEPSFFGFLAADQLGAGYALCHAPRPLQPEVMAQVLRDRNMRRALELHHVELPHFARLEWSASVAGKSAAYLKQAAMIAAQEGWYEKAISGLSSQSTRRLYRDRFPIAYRAEFEAAGKQYGLPPSLLLAIARAESALTADAVSRAGARGLMQIMPATADRLNRLKNVGYREQTQLFMPALNIEFGALHLRELLDQFDGHWALALAGYNAGPNAVERWLGRYRPATAMHWVEAIPYRETREYISKVLAFQVVYSWRMDGRPQRVSNWLQPLDRVPESRAETASAYCAS